MTIALYDVSIPVLSAALTNLSAILDKAMAHAVAKKFDSKAFAESRLIADMHPLTTLPELKARIAKAQDFLQSIKPEQINGNESRQIEVKVPGATLKFTGHTYVTTFVLPNFFFHATTAYALLRQNGVDIGKVDFLGSRIGQ
jgi:hypothetical protein